jgi:hypothetical protein
VRVHAYVLMDNHGLCHTADARGQSERCDAVVSRQL